MVEFYRKKTISDFAELNKTFPDSYDSFGALNYGRTFRVGGASATTHNDYGYSSVKSGPVTSKGYFRSSIADKPTYGSASLKRMDAYFFIEDVILDNNATTTPNMAMYLVKPESIQDTLTAGKLRLEPTERGMGHLSAISASVNSYISDSEEFTGLPNEFKYDNSVSFQAVGRKVFKYSGTLYLEIDDAYPVARITNKHGQKIEDYGYSKAKFRRRYGATLDNPTSGTKRKVIKIRKKSGDGGYYENKDGEHKCYFKPYQIESLIQGADRDDLESDPSYQNQVSTGNTFFDVVKHDKELILSRGEGEGQLIGTCLSRFSTDELLRGDGQSMNMFAYWEGDNRIDNTLITAAGDQRLKDLYIPSSNPDPDQFEDTQETFTCYGPVPFPAHMYPGGLANEPITPTSSITSTHADNDFTKSTHGFQAGDAISFPSGIGNSQIIVADSSGNTATDIDTTRIYYVSATGLTTNDFRIGYDPTGGTESFNPGTSPTGGDFEVNQSSPISLTTADGSGIVAYTSSNDGLHSDTGIHSNGTIEIDISLKNLDTAKSYTTTVDSASKDCISMVKRNFVITMGYHKPNTEDTLISYVDKHCPLSAIDDGHFIHENTTDAPFLGWSFFRTKGATGDFKDGIHVVGSSRWKHLVDRGSDTGNNNKHDIWIQDGGTDDDADTDRPTGGNAGLVPSDSYFTFKLVTSPCTGAFANNIEWGIFDPKTDLPIPLDGAEFDDFNSIGTTHFWGDHTRSNMWWTGREGCDSSGIDFWTEGNNGGVDYFEASTANNDAGGPRDAAAVWPRYLTLWLTNSPNTSSGTSDDRFLENDGGETSITINGQSEFIRRPTSSSIFVDGIRFKDFNFDHNNATVPDAGVNPDSLTIPSGISSMATRQAPGLYSQDTHYPGSTTLCFGTDTQSDFKDASQDKGILLNNFITKVGQTREVPYNHIRVSATTDYDPARFEITGSPVLYTDIVAPLTDTEGGESFFGNQARTSHMGGGSANNQATDSNYLIDIDNSDTHAVVLDGGTGSIDNFTNKGYIHLKGNIHTALDTKDSISTNGVELTKRECIYTSARVLRMSSRSEGVYKVDTTTIFRGHENDTFIAYLYGSPYRSTTNDGVGTVYDIDGGDAKTCNTSVRLLEIIDDKHVKLDWNGMSNANYDMVSERQIPYLMISPLKYWLFVNIKNYETKKTRSGSFLSFNNLSAKTYDTALLTTTSSDVSNIYGTFGMTYNEFLYNDAPTIVGSVENKWDHDVDEEETILDLRDFGFGAFSEDTNTGGYLSLNIPKLNTYNKFKMDNIFSTSSNLEAGDNLDFILDTLGGRNEVIYHNNILASQVSNDVGTNHDDKVPYLVTVFEDEKPNNPTLTVQPYSEDAFLPEYKWSIDGDDLWYGFLIIDSKPINSQYHEAILHFPLNEKGDNATAVSTGEIKNKASLLNNNDAVATSETGGITVSGPTYDLEGLAGNCLRFDGNDDNITYDDSDSTTLADLTTEASWVAHCIPDSDIDGNENYIIKTGQCDIYIAGSSAGAEYGSVIALVHEDGSNSVKLSSSRIELDGQTPCNIIVTFDNTLKSGNCKLFVNGKLEDQSGLRLSSSATMGGTGTSWKAGTPVRASGNPFRIGHSTDSFKGRIEEVVVYKKAIYPVVPSDGSFVLDKPLQELSLESPVSYSARLFVKDYHNIRGSTSDEVAASSSVSFRKAAFRLKDS